MKRLLIIIVFFLCFVLNVNASTNGEYICTSDNSPLNVRDKVNGSYIGDLKCNSKFAILDDKAGTTDNCKAWYKIKNDSIEGYACGDFIKKDEKPNPVPDIDKPKPEVKPNPNLKGKVACFENDDPLSVRNSINGKVVDKLSCGSEMKIIDKNAGTNFRCPLWYKVSYSNNKEGFVCSTYVTTEVDFDPNSKEVTKYKEKLKKDGFPDSYIDSLVKIHMEHPSWNFKVFNTNLNWKDVIDSESVKGRNLVYSSYGIGYRCHEDYAYDWATDTYHRHPTEVNWWYASREAIEYYMDPRNYLDSKSIFSFESLSYEPAFQTEDVVNTILGKSFMPSIYKKYSEEGYTKSFIRAADKYKVSPVHLSSRILQEQGMNGSIASLGNEFNYNGNTYSGYFNFYNIGATGKDPAIQGLVWAMGGINNLQTSYNRPWNTPDKSIVGGAEFLSKDYISLGQNTLYFQKFDVSRNDGHYTHQYMQNLTAQYTEGLKTYSSYSEIGSLLDKELVFIIPVFNNMPKEKVKAPENKSPNSYLKTIKVGDKTIEDYIFYKLNYDMVINTNIDKINISATPINSEAKIEGLGDYKLKDGINNITINVTAEDGTKTAYTINIDKQSKKEEIELSSNNSLKELTIDKIKFEFNKDKLIYDLSVDNSIDKITINYVLDDKNASASGEKNVDLIVGLNKIEIKVTAENKSTKTYTLNITRSDKGLSDTLNKIGVKYNDKYMYGIKAESSTSNLIDNIKSVNKNIIVSIKSKDNKIKEGIFATGDKITISNGSESKTFAIVIYGDVNGDSKIDKLDYLAVLRHFYKYTEYKDAYKEAADANHDGVVDKLDYLAILRDYYGYKKIEQ